MTNLEMPARWAFLGRGEPSGAGRRYFLMGHELRVSCDLIFWLHPLVFLDPGPGLGGWVP